MEPVSFQPISNQEATAICKRFQHLIGNPFDATTPGRGTIEAIVPAPWEEAHQWQFAQYFRDFKDGEKCVNLL